MNVRKMKTVACLVLVLAVSFFIAAGANAQQSKLSFSIVTGGTGGVWYPLGGAIGGVIGKYVPNTEATSEATTAAIDNMKLLGAGKAGMAFAYDYHVGWANDGKVPGIPAKHKIRLVMGLYDQPIHIVTTSGTGITNVMQLKGKRVSVGAPNSGTEEQADYVFKALGIDWNKEIKASPSRRSRTARSTPSSGAATSRPAPSSTWPPPPAQRWYCCRSAARRRIGS
jgi:TRAP transporter TAXI family solute receptor